MSCDFRNNRFTHLTSLLNKSQMILCLIKSSKLDIYENKINIPFTAFTYSFTYKPLEAIGKYIYHLFLSNFLSEG